MPATGITDHFSEDILSEALGTLPHVRRILMAQHGSRVAVWTVVDDFELSARNPIYEVQQLLIERYRDRVRFEFHVIPGDDQTTISHATTILTK